MLYGRIAQGAAAKIVTGSKDTDIVRDTNEIFEANASMTRDHGVAANMDVIPELDSAPSGNDNKWIDPDP